MPQDDQPDLTLSRRTLLGLGAALGAGAALAPSAALAAPAGMSTAGPAGRGGTRAVSMAMHVHSCFSEGDASMQAQLAQATDLGVDVLWWTDHDFRLQAHGYRQAVRFEGLSEPEAGLSWEWVPASSGTVASTAADFVSEPHSPDEPGRALRLSATGPAEGWGTSTLEGKAWNTTYTTSLAATVLELDVLAEQLGADAELLVEIASSYRPATGGRPAGTYTLQYRVGPAAGWWTEGNGLLGVVAVAAPAGSWQRLRLDLERDVAALWPDIVAGDSGLCKLRVGVRSRRGVAASAVIDRLRFLRSRREGDESVALQGEMIAEYSRRYPAVRQYMGSELSLVRHVNAFGGDFRLPDYGDAPPRKNTSVAAAVAMVDFAHSFGALATFNHPLEEAPTGPELARVLIETSALGADMVEVGSKEDLDQSIYGFDAAARNAVFVTATGVNDDHAGRNWLGQKRRWMTSVWAPSVEQADLFAALRAGRAWFWDALLWPGTIEITARGNAAMGAAVVTPARQVPVRITATAPPAGGSLELVTGVVDHAGTADPAPSVTRTRLDPRGGGPIDVSVGLPDEHGRYLRVEVRDAAGALVGFSNPVWLLREEPPGGIPAERRA